MSDLTFYLLLEGSPDGAEPGDVDCPGCGVGRPHRDRPGRHRHQSPLQEEPTRGCPGQGEKEEQPRWGSGI